MDFILENRNLKIVILPFLSEVRLLQEREKEREREREREREMSIQEVGQLTHDIGFQAARCILMNLLV